MASVKYGPTGAVAADGSSFAGGDMLVSAGAGNGSTNRGGNLNMKAGAAVSTGIPGEYQANGDPNMVFANYNFTGTPAATNQVFFIAPRACIVKSISEVHATAAGGASTMTITKDTGTTAPGSGTSLHQSGSFDLNGTANTVQNATVATTQATVSLAAGDRLSVKFANAIQSSAGVAVVVGLSYL